VERIEHRLAQLEVTPPKKTHSTFGWWALGLGLAAASAAAGAIIARGLS
jgi:hypothetical protein